MRSSQLQALHEKLKAAEQATTDAGNAAVPIPDPEEGGREGKGSGNVLVYVDRPLVVNEHAGPLEFLVSRNELELLADPAGMGAVRFHTALRFRDLMAGSQVKGFHSPDWSSAGGGGGGGAGNVRAHQIDCMIRVGEIRGSMRKPWMFQLLERVVFHDEWLNLFPDSDPDPKKRGRKTRARQQTVLSLHYVLDVAGMTFGHVTNELVRQRWKTGEPSPARPVRRRMRGTRA
ncbi:MAG: hypothetical protein KGZ68_01080 [Dechloromonas sp.]|nr:hypothetical protein [Dechloromonas sp.]